jgi:cellulose synthase/poly-beta-1,6-N-acetylglucosamine synthase-like glycosyltransferase
MINEIFEALLYISSFFTSFWILLQVFYFKTSLEISIKEENKLSEIINNKEEKEKRKIDIIVAIKNENEKVIKELIDNLSRLDYEPYEVIIVSDDTEEHFNKIIQYIGNIPNNIKIIRRQNNEGRKAGALNYALNFSNGDLLVFLDAEARVDKKFLRKVAELNYDAIAFRLKIREPITPTQKTYAYMTEFVMDSLFKSRQKLGLIIFPNGSSFAVKRSVLDTIGGWKNGAIAEDLELGIRLALNNIRVKYVDDIIIYSLAPFNNVDLYNQIRRWAYGSAELFISSAKLLKFGLKGFEGFIYTQQWAIYPLYLIILLITLSLQFVLKIPYSIILGSLSLIIFSIILYGVLIRPKGDYRSAMITTLASLIGYVEGILKMKFNWKVTPKELDKKEESILGIKILGLILAVSAYANSLFNNIFSSILLILISISLLLLQF